jgi:preprotein translocase subunit SecG
MVVLKGLLIFLLILTALVLILIVLVQRGKGGGLAGALGGMGGQSAFGTKAGDLFTRITIGVAAFWIILCIVSVWVMGIHSDLLEGGGDNPLGAASAPAPEGAKGATEGTAGGAAPAAATTPAPTSTATPPAGGSAPAGKPAPAK